MPEKLKLVATPNDWLEEILAGRGITRAALARLIGRSRVEIQRWANGREQIPRHHLAEIACQVCPEQLEYALRLKDCEDLDDRLRRYLRELSRRANVELRALEEQVYDIVRTNVSQTEYSYQDLASYLRTITDACFIFRLWLDGSSTCDFAQILTAANVHRHIRYPTHHFLGLALDFGSARRANAGTSGRFEEFTERALGQIRDVALAEGRSDGALVNGHALHMLARHGTQEDGALVQELLADTDSFAEPLRRRLGHVGLMLRSADADGTEAMERYAWLLEKDEDLADADLYFDAVHYGDADLGKRQTSLTSISDFSNTASNLLRHLEHRDQYALRIDSMRLTRLLDKTGPTLICQPALRARIDRIVSASPPQEAPNEYVRLITRLGRISN